MKLHYPTKNSPPEILVIKHKSKKWLLQHQQWGKLFFVPVSKIPYLHT